MTHRRASRLLAALLDDGLSPELRTAVRAHARGCSACRRRLREHETVEALVRLLPASLLPLEPSTSAQVRLWGLAHWFIDPVARARERLGLSAVGVGIAVVAAMLSLSIQGWDPAVVDPAGIVLAQALPDAVDMLPLGWR